MSSIKRIFALCLLAYGPHFLEANRRNFVEEQLESIRALLLDEQFLQGCPQGSCCFMQKQFKSVLMEQLLQQANSNTEPGETLIELERQFDQLFGAFYLVEESQNIRKKYYEALKSLKSISNTDSTEDFSSRALNNSIDVESDIVQPMEYMIAIDTLIKKSMNRADGGVLDTLDSLENELQCPNEPLCSILSSMGQQKKVELNRAIKTFALAFKASEQNVHSSLSLERMRAILNLGMPEALEEVREKVDLLGSVNSRRDVQMNFQYEDGLADAPEWSSFYLSIRETKDKIKQITAQASYQCLDQLRNNLEKEINEMADCQFIEADTIVDNIICSGHKSELVEHATANFITLKEDVENIISLLPSDFDNIAECDAREDRPVQMAALGSGSGQSSQQEDGQNPKQEDEVEDEVVNSFNQESGQNPKQEDEVEDEVVNSFNQESGQNPKQEDEVEDEVVNSFNQESGQNPKQEDEVEDEVVNSFNQESGQNPKQEDEVEDEVVNSFNQESGQNPKQEDEVEDEVVNSFNQESGQNPKQEDGKQRKKAVIKFFNEDNIRMLNLQHSMILAPPVSVDYGTVYSPAIFLQQSQWAFIPPVPTPDFFNLPINNRPVCNIYFCSNPNSYFDPQFNMPGRMGL